MMIKVIRMILVTLLILNGLLFVSNIYVLGDREAAIAMHDDILPAASSFLVNLKVVICFLVGILYLVSAYGIIRKKHKLAIHGIAGFILFEGFYIYELSIWATAHPRIWIDFTLFGGISLLLGMFCLYNYQNRFKTSS